MKYIRTKDGCITEGNFEIGKMIATLYGDEQIAKENTADTIEELCDEFVGIDDGKPQMLRFVPYACAQYWSGGVYGAIWTDKGLIYVAKMNEQGEMELL